MHIHPDTAIHQIQLEDGSFCIRCYGVGDNPKQGLWFDKSITELLNASAIPLSAVFDGEEQSLWDARLFPVCKTREKALLWTQRIMDWIASGILVEEVREAWIASERMSLANELPRCRSTRLPLVATRAGDRDQGSVVLSIDRSR